MKKFIALLLCAIALFGCSTSRNASLVKTVRLENYKYFYVMGSEQLVSADSRTMGRPDSYGDAATNVFYVNPADIIGGYMMKRGFVRTPQPYGRNNGRTLLIAFGESDSVGAKTEVTIQFLDASSNELVARSTASGAGMKKAIWNCLDRLFK